MEGFKTFDIILFSGKDYWFSDVVEFFTWSDISHVGILLRDPYYIGEDLPGLYLFESGKENTPDVVRHQLIWGVQLTDFETIIKSYEGRVWRREMNTVITPTMLKNLEEVYNKVYGEPYDCSVVDFIRAETGKELDGDCRKTNKFFCSSFVGYILSEIGLLPKDFEFGLLRPKDFLPGYSVDGNLKGATLGRMERLK